MPALTPVCAAPGRRGLPASSVPTILPRKVLRDYQRSALDYTFRTPHPALFMDMRLGKTLIAIRRIKAYRKCTKILVVGPYSVLKGWMEELTGERETWHWVRGTQQQRKDEFEMIAEPGRKWFITNKEIHLSVPEVAQLPWDVLVLDESIVIANNTKIQKFFTSNFRGVKHRWVLCGTPAPESELQYWGQLAFLDPKILNGMGYWRFRHEHFIQNRFDWRISDEGKKFLASILSTNTFCLKRSEVKMGGVKVRETRMVQLHKDLRSIYKKAEDKFALETEHNIQWSRYAIQKHLWLKRICGGFVDGELAGDHKARELINILTGELSGQQTVVWAWFVEELKYIKEEIVKAGMSAEVIYGNVPPEERYELIDSFQRGEIDHLVIQPDTTKFGAKLTAASSLIYYSSPESALIREQSEDRSIDLEKTDNILIIDIIVMDTVDEDLQVSLIRKETRVETLRRLIKGAKCRNTKPTKV